VTFPPATPAHPQHHVPASTNVQAQLRLACADTCSHQRSRPACFMCSTCTARHRRSISARALVLPRAAAPCAPLALNATLNAMPVHQRPPEAASPGNCVVLGQHGAARGVTRQDAAARGSARHHVASRGSTRQDAAGRGAAGADADSNSRHPYPLGAGAASNSRPVAGASLPACAHSPFLGATGSAASFRTIHPLRCFFRPPVWTGAACPHPAQAACGRALPQGGVCVSVSRHLCIPI
jgi:hypothetical protein